MVVLEVSDTGIGIPETAFPNIFQRFYQVESQGRKFSKMKDNKSNNKELNNMNIEADEISENDRKYKGKVLIVDNNKDTRDYLADLLNEFDVYRPCDGQNAIRTLKTVKKLPDLILSGKSDVKTQLIAVILLSAKVSETSKIRDLDKGANDYLIKPYSNY
ncbi:hypothetical protein C2G38_2185534 [Gigaspora rosea]|uniref:Response regulatory domain-containing protein n=1 Tax=Gigaspora rosea TaxID=44941 RepID=A0A397VDK6_9GLOM|nr:hypothetical protein C2G38_2185534 [Gigaspora rosea]